MLSSSSNFWIYMNRTIMFGQPTQVVLEQAIENKYVFSRARFDPFLYDMHMRQLLTLFYKEPHRFHEQLWKLKKHWLYQRIHLYSIYCPKLKIYR